ncbi:catecholate siderophore receptor Fiu [Undibacterium fentianense]|uniref:Catecholate siderophore receptor Fiu n=1 Tax=Undibacterium fentianense TaxID=2828728 RepID=A0A941DZW0_9BURK|nr:catecholate siderophore receptor Fiu [Undibacterium fentianense]MBR7799870.1 catecholate siderophore receptor Fiu [Undibacterium fentianense]
MRQATILSTKHTLTQPEQHKKMGLQYSAILASLMLPVALQAHAQQANEDKKAPTKQEQQLQEIAVVAGSENAFKASKAASNKYTQPLIDTPQTISVIKRELIEQQGAINLTDALRNTPGVGTFFLGENGSTNTGDAIYMRGFDASNSIFVDGVRDLGSISRDMFNIEQIDVLKGSAGTDSGRSAATGSVNLSSKQAHLDDASFLQFSLGTAQQKRFTADKNVVLDAPSGAALRLNLMGQDSGVAGRDIVQNRRWGFAPSLVYGLNTDTQWTLNFLHVEQDNVPDGGVPTIGLPGYASPDTKRPYISAANSVNPSNFYGSVSDFDQVEANMLTGKIEHRLSPTAKISNTTRVGTTTQHYLLTAFMGNAANLVTPNANDLSTWTLARNTRTLKDQQNDILTNQTNLQLELQVGGIKHNILGGVELTHEQQKTSGYSGTGTLAAANLYQPNPSDPVSGLQLQKNGVFTRGATNTNSAYLFDTVELNAQWQIHSGLRIDRYQTDYSAASLSTASSHPNLPVGTLVPLNLNSSGNLINWKFGTVYKPVNHGSVYLSLSTSKQPPGGSNFALSSSASSAANPKFDPQETRNVEIGTKWDFLKEKISLTAAIYQTEVSNEVVQNLNDLLYYQTGKKEVSGVELGITGAITRDWLISAAYANTSTKVASGPTVTANGENNLAYAPKQTFTAWTSYQTQSGIKLGGGIRFVDALLRGTDSAIGTPAKTAAYWVADAMLSYPLNRRLDLQLNLYNLTDETYVAAINKSGYRYTPGTPRSASLTFNLKF